MSSQKVPLAQIDVNAQFKLNGQVYTRLAQGPGNINYNTVPALDPNGRNAFFEGSTIVLASGRSAD
jgi:hypothetical protein